MRCSPLLVMLVAATLASPCASWAQSGGVSLLLQVSNYHDRPIPGVILSAKGTGSTGQPTDIAGKTQLVLPQGTQPGGNVFLILVRAPSKDLQIFSPLHGRATVPLPGDFVEVYLGVRGTVAALTNPKIVDSLAVAINKMNAEPPPVGGGAEDSESQRRQDNLAEASKELGLEPNQVDDAIRELAKRVGGTRGEKIFAEYLEAYPGHRGPASKNAKTKSRWEPDQ
jgi:hypothetical protein